MIKRTRRSIAAVTAALGVGIGGAAWATSAASAAPSAAISECRSGQLAVWVSADAGNGAAGSVYYPLEFTNVSSRTCFVIGWPGVSALDASGHQLGLPAGRDPVVARTFVTLLPGATAHATLRYVQVANYPAARCKPVRAATLKVYPPDQTVYRDAYFSLLACSAKGPLYLSVTRIQPGPTVP